MSLRHYLLSATILAAPLMAALAYAQTVDPFDLLFSEEADNIDAGEDDQTGDDDLQVLTFRLRELTIDDGFVAYRTSAGLCLPFKETVELFEFPIDIEEEKTASGWFITPEQKIEIDFETQSTEINGKTVELEDEAFFQTADGWCATTDAMSEIFPINFEHDERHLRIQATPQVILPLEERLEREVFRAENLLARAPDDKSYPMLDNPYRWMSWPVADIGVDVKTGSAGDVSLSFEVEAAADILKTTGRVRTVGRGANSVLNNLRMTFGRTSLEPKLLGPLKARSFRLGDISTQPVPLVSNSINGAGVIVTNRSSFNADLFDTTEIRGALPINWEAELYTGEELIAFVVKPDSNGDYVFEDVPLRAGFNRFTVRLYGPYGEKEERVVKYFIGAELEPENETVYAFGIVDGKSPVIKSLGFADDFTDLTEGQDSSELTGALTTDISDIFGSNGSNENETTNNLVSSSGLIAVGSLSRGLSDRLSVRLDGIVGLSKSNKDNKAGVVTLSSSVLGGYGSLRVASRGKGRPAVEAGFQRRLLRRSSVSTRYVDFGDFESDISGYGESRTTRIARVRGNTFIALGKRSLPIHGEVRYAESQNGAQQIDALGRTSTDWNHFRITNTLQYSHLSDGGDKTSNLDGSMLFARRYKGTRWLGGVGYNLKGNLGINNVGISAQREFAHQNIGSLSVVHELDDKKTALSGSWAKPFKRATVAASGTVDLDGNWTAGLRLGMSLSKQPDRLRPSIISRSELSRNGGLRPHVFIDTDLDGVYSDGDENVEDVQFVVSKGQRDQRTDSSGSVIIDKISTEAQQSIQINLSSLDDPFLLPINEGHSFVIRPGQILSVSMPLQATGDAEGHLNVQKGEQTIAVGGTPIQVLDENDKVVAESQTDFDGYFYIEKLPLKKLRFRIPAKALKGTGAVSKDVPFELTADDPSLFGVELVIYDN